MLTNAASMGRLTEFSILPHPSLNKIYVITILNPDLDILSGYLPTFPQVCKPINYKLLCPEPSRIWASCTRWSGRFGNHIRPFVWWSWKWHLSFATCLFLPGPFAEPALSAVSGWRKPQLQFEGTSLEIRNSRACTPALWWSECAIAGQWRCCCPPPRLIL